MILKKIIFKYTGTIAMCDIQNKHVSWEFHMVFFIKILHKFIFTQISPEKNIMWIKSQVSTLSHEMDIKFFMYISLLLFISLKIWMTLTFLLLGLLGDVCPPLCNNSSADVLLVWELCSSRNLGSLYTRCSGLLVRGQCTSIWCILNTGFGFWLSFSCWKFYQNWIM